MNLDDVIKNNVIAEIKSKLFEAAQHLGEDVLKESVKAIHSFLGCTECSLWSINHNNTQEEGEKRDFTSTSLIFRESTASYVFQKDTDYVHDLKDGLFKQVIYTEKMNNPVFVYDKDKVLEYGYRSKDFVDKGELTQFIVIPIYDSNHLVINTPPIVIALLEISYQKCDIGESVWKEISGVISPFFTTALKRVSSVKKQSLMGNLIDCHRKHKNKEIEDLFKEIIYDVLLKACPAQGVSVFIWDDRQDCYYLAATTELEDTTEPLLKEFCQIEETKISKPLIIDFIKKEELQDTIEIHREEPKNLEQTKMLIPIKDPSNGKGVIGFFDMVNKTNVCNDKYIDFFNDNDVELMLDAAEYLGLIIANYQKEESLYDFIGKLTHEMITPANAIWKTASRLYSHLEEKDFISQNLSPYLKNIIDFAELQRWQASTNLFLSRNRRKQTLEVRYIIKPTSLWEIIRSSIDIAIPIALKYNVKANNISINPTADKQLIINIDKDAFVTVFYNLFTNAIKYHDPDDKDNFYIETSYRIENDYVFIDVADNGIGIKPKDQNKVFEKGYRSESAIRINASGYGIGLTVVKQIVEDFGGEIKITNFRKPTIFHIEIPVKQ